MFAPDGKMQTRQVGLERRTTRRAALTASQMSGNELAIAESERWFQDGVDPDVSQSNLTLFWMKADGSSVGHDPRWPRVLPLMSSILQQRLHNMVNPEMPEVGVCLQAMRASASFFENKNKDKTIHLSTPNKENRLACDIGH